MNDQVYDYADRITLSLAQVIWRVYLKYQKKIISTLVRSDSSSQIKQILVELYSELDELNIITLKEIAGRAYGFAEGNKRIDWGEWLFVLLNKPNSVTQYIYTSEVIRKRDRLLEAVLTIKADASANSAFDRKAINHAMKRAFSFDIDNSWTKFCRLEALDAEESVSSQAVIFAVTSPMKQGDAFSIMQNALKATGYGAELVIDGKWGNKSQQAFNALVRAHSEVYDASVSVKIGGVVYSGIIVREGGA